MSGSSARMLELLSLLQTHRFWSGSELAERLEVSQRTLRRDVERLRDLGYPVDAIRGVDGGYQLQGGAALPPLLLDDEEAVAIAVGLRAAAGGVVAGLEETSVRALTKIVQVMPSRLRRRVDALQAYTVPVMSQAATIDASSLSVLAQACRDDERLEFDYTARDGAATRRLVEPHRLVCLGRRWYLVAWDTTRHDWRTFRVDRLAEPVTTGARFRQRELPGGDAAAFVQNSIQANVTRYPTVTLVHTGADVVRRAFGRWAEVEEIDAGTCRMRMETDTFDWPAMALASLGTEFRVEEPVELREHVREIGERFARAVGG